MAKEDQLVAQNQIPTESISTKKEHLVLKTIDASVFYGDMHAIKNVNINIKAHTVTSFIGPSGCGKSTFLKIV